VLAATFVAEEQCRCRPRNAAPAARDSDRIRPAGCSWPKPVALEWSGCSAWLLRLPVEKVLQVVRTLGWPDPGLHGRRPGQPWEQAVAGVGQLGFDFAACLHYASCRKLA